jgi:hypothetical protein
MLGTFNNLELSLLAATCLPSSRVPSRAESPSPTRLDENHGHASGIIDGFCTTTLLSMT